MEVDQLLCDLKVTTIYPQSTAKRITESVQLLRRTYLQLRSLAPKFDFPGIPANGLRSHCRLVDKFCYLSRGHLSRADISAELIADVIELLNAMGQVIVETKRLELTLNNNDAGRKKDRSSVFLRDVAMWWDFAKANQSRLASYFDKFTLFYIEPELRSFIALFGKSFASISSPPTILGSLLSSSLNGAALSQLTVNGSLYYPLRAWSLFDNPIVNSVASWQAAKYSVAATTIYVPRQNQYIIPCEGSAACSTSKQSNMEMVDRPDLSKPVRCRLLRSTRTPANGKLLLHISGGGFVMFKPEANEGSYLRYWVGHLDGTTLLSIDYTKLVTYPVAFQEVLDVYLWSVGLIQSDLDPESIFGFKPDSIVLCGDSAGSHLAFSIFRSLHDIQSANGPNEKGKRIPFPSAFVSFYSNMTVNSFQASLSLSCLETALTPSVMLSIYGLLASGLILDEDEVSKGSYLEPDSIRDNIRTWFIHGKNWFDCEHSELVRRLKLISHHAAKAYLQPLTELDLDRLAELPLYLIVGEFDFFLDGSVNLARAWKGHVSLDVVENLNHGFLSYSKVSAEARRGCRIGLKRLREALQL